jgi:lipoprotein signal peptidase
VSPADAAATSGPVDASERPAAALLCTRFGWVALLVALDLWSKAAVFGWLKPLSERHDLPLHDCALLGHQRYPLLGDWLGFMLSTNPGAAFGKLGDMPYLLVGGRVLAAVFLIWLIVRASPKKPWVAAAFVLILGGALGNLYDNLLLDQPHDQHPFGPVRDFIDVYFGFADWHFPTFNVADSCISVGATILVLNGLFTRPAKPEPAPAA